MGKVPEASLDYAVMNNKRLRGEGPTRHQRLSYDMCTMVRVYSHTHKHTTHKHQMNACMHDRMREECEGKKSQSQLINEKSSWLQGHSPGRVQIRADLADGKVRYLRVWHQVSVLSQVQCLHA